MFVFFFSKAIQYTHSFILECYAPLLLYTSTHILILMQTIHLFHCNLCLLFLLLYCELYASTLLHATSSQCVYTSMPLQFWYCSVNYMLVLFYATPSLCLYTSTAVHLYTFTPVHLYACTPLHLYPSTPVLLNTSTPLRLYTSTLVRHSFMVHFSVYFFCCMFKVLGIEV